MVAKALSPIGRYRDALRKGVPVLCTVRQLLATILFVLAALSPTTTVAQTPHATTAEPSYYVETIAVTRPGDLVHALVRLVIDPGGSTPPLNVTPMYSVVLHVQQGTIRITTSEGSARISAGAGTPVSYGTDEAETCDGDPCTLASGQSAVLGPDNSLATEEGLLGIEVVGDQRATIYVSLLMPQSSEEEFRGSTATPTMPMDPNSACWICPPRAQP
jgi:hypothetical protein